MITNTSNYSSFSSIESIVERYSNQYENIDFAIIDENIWFLIRPINRNEYKIIFNNSTKTTVEKKDEICKRCILYPTNFDLENCSAGIPEQVYQRIMEISYLELDQMVELIEINRYEMEMLDNQMLCIVSKAFPHYSYEEIENMDMIQICKLFTRAEWILKNLDGNNNLLDILDVTKEALKNNDISNEDVYKPKEEKEEKIEYENKYNIPVEKIEEKPVSKMTEEQRQALDDFYNKFPEFNKSTDYMYTGKIHQEYKDPPALRTNWGRR